jgi:hypothetical protein
MARGDVTLERSRLRNLSTAHLRRMPDQELVDRVRPFAAPGRDPELVAALVPALRGVHTLTEAADLIACVASQPAHRPLPEMAAIRSRYPEHLSEAEARDLVDELRREGVPLKEARLALTGRDHGPELWAVLAALPRDEAMRRAA